MQETVLQLHPILPPPSVLPGGGVDVVRVIAEELQEGSDLVNPSLTCIFMGHGWVGLPAYRASEPARGRAPEAFHRGRRNNWTVSRASIIDWHY